jgi:ectoine hydroxylase-related dioxygenase (phytanoyl-CoA dioxygenase family)
VLDPEGDAGLWTAVDEALRDEGLLEMVRVFHGAVWSKLNSLAIFVNPANWTGPAFRDNCAGTPPTAGMHIDSNGKSYLKMILYLNEVGAEQGPTSVVPGSHAWDCGSVDRIRRRAFDRSRLLGRKMMDRKSFISLPEELQVKAEFGGDLLPGGAETEALLASEFVSTGERGHYTVFNPEAVHRGGAVTAGERHALQITLGARW